MVIVDHDTAEFEDYCYTHGKPDEGVLIGGFSFLDAEIDTPREKLNTALLMASQAHRIGDGDPADQAHPYCAADHHLHQLDVDLSQVKELLRALILAVVALGEK